MLLTRLRTRRLRFAIITVSHTPGNCATSFTWGQPPPVSSRAAHLASTTRSPGENANASATGNANAARWHWQRGGWRLSIGSRDRSRSLICLSWIPSTQAPAGITITSPIAESPNSEKLYAVVTQVGRGRPVLKKGCRRRRRRAPTRNVHLQRGSAIPCE